MNRHFLTCLAIVWLGSGNMPRLVAADTAAPVVTPAMQKRIDQKVARLIDTAKVADAAKVERVKAIGAEWFAALFAWHEANDAQLDALWVQWNKARAVVPKDEFPGELIATKIEETYASLQPAYAGYIQRLSGELTPEQIDAVKEAWSRSPGMRRTYNSYLEIVPDLSERDKEVIRARLHLAREAAMLTDADREIVNIFKRHKVKVEQYIGTLEWAKLHGAFAKRGAAAEAARKAAPPEKK
jgi:hypothetical protein